MYMFHSARCRCSRLEGVHVPCCNMYMFHLSGTWGAKRTL